MSTDLPHHDGCRHAGTERQQAINNHRADSTMTTLSRVSRNVHSVLPRTAPLSIDTPCMPRAKYVRYTYVHCVMGKNGTFNQNDMWSNDSWHKQTQNIHDLSIVYSDVHILRSILYWNAHIVSNEQTPSKLWINFMLFEHLHIYENVLGGVEKLYMSKWCLNLFWQMCITKRGKRSFGSGIPR